VHVGVEVRGERVRSKAPGTYTVPFSVSDGIRTSRSTLTVVVLDNPWTKDVKSGPSLRFGRGNLSRSQFSRVP
jgi:hypothetical protein